MKNRYSLILITIIGFSSILLYSNYYFRVNLSDISKNGGNSQFNPSLSSSCSLSLEWSITWGGTDSDTGRGIAIDADDNIYVAGYTSSYGEGLDDVCLVKYDSSGLFQWSKTWGSAANLGLNNEFGHDLTIDSEGNIYVTGYTEILGEEDFCLIKFDSSGDIIWNETYGGVGDDRTYGIAVDSESNVYMVGQTNSFGSNNDIWLIKYNKTGHFQWNVTWDSGVSDYGDDIIIHSDSSIFITGHSYFGAYSEVCLISYDTNGNQLWNTTWGGIDYQKGRALAMDDNENIYITGSTDGDIFLVKFDSSGNHLWNITWGGDEDDNAADIRIDEKNNIWIAGSTRSFGPPFDVFLIQFDSTGNNLCNTTWGGSNNDGASCLIADSSNNTYISGYTASFGAGGGDLLILKYTAKSSKSTVIPFGNTYIYFIIIGNLLIMIQLIRKRQYRIREKSNL
jgi:hypothetical protein